MYFQIIWKKSSLVPRLIFYCIKISRMHISSIMRYAVASLIRTCVLLDVRNRPLKGKYNKLLIDWNIYFYGFQLQINSFKDLPTTLRLSNNRILLAIGNSLQTYHQYINSLHPWIPEPLPHLLAIPWRDRIKDIHNQATWKLKKKYYANFIHVASQTGHSSLKLWMVQSSKILWHIVLKNTENCASQKKFYLKQSKLYSQQPVNRTKKTFVSFSKGVEKKLQRSEWCLSIVFYKDLSFFLWVRSKRICDIFW